MLVWRSRPEYVYWYTDDYCDRLVTIGTLNGCECIVIRILYSFCIFLLSLFVH